MKKEDHARIVNINSRHHNINSFDSNSRSRSREVSRDLGDFASQVQRAHLHQIRSFEDRTHESLIPMPLPMEPNQVSRHLEPLVLALDQNEEQELKSLMGKHHNKNKNTQFLKDLQRVKSKVSSFKDKTQRVLSLKKYNESEQQA